MPDNHNPADAERLRDEQERSRQRMELERQDREMTRIVGEAARVAGETRRAEAEVVRQDAMGEVRTATEVIQETLQRMEHVEALRRAVREADAGSTKHEPGN